MDSHDNHNILKSLGNEVVTKMHKVTTTPTTIKLTSNLGKVNNLPFPVSFKTNKILETTLNPTKRKHDVL